MAISGLKVVEKAQNYLIKSCGKQIKNCTAVEIHNALAAAVIDELSISDWQKSRQVHENVKTAYYLSAEFLIGRVIFNNLLCLGIYDEVKDLLSQRGFAIERLEEIEDAALGNGGLGRLAACFLDSAATLKLPLNGYGIRYKFGLFKQAIENGFQVEYADDWTRFGDFWSFRREGYDVEVKFSDQTVIAVAYDMPIIGYNNSHVCTLRLWEARSVEGFNFEKFNSGDYYDAFKKENDAAAISSVLYPNDDKVEGKILRLKQQYFFCSASVQDVLKRFKLKFGNDFSKFSEFNMFQINDTHPVIAIAELIRLLCEKEGLEFKQAFKIARESFAYTNHTVMAEALEKWSLNLIKQTIPHVLTYILKIQKEFEDEMARLKVSSDVVDHVAPIQNDMVHMANLAVFSTKVVNGVSAIHTQILMEDVLKDWYAIYPERFQNKTNGITQRRWLLLANPRLSALVTKLLNSSSWITDLSQLKNLEKFALDEAVAQEISKKMQEEHMTDLLKVNGFDGYAKNLEVLNEFIKIKNENKKVLVDYLKKTQNLVIDSNTIFDVQIKRLHEYKRQLLNILAILHLYFKIDEGSLLDFEPTTFIFGAKAAPGYVRAKGIIKLINSVAELIESNEKVRKFIKVVFIANYNVSYAEKLFAAADVSEQISVAGTEASGTGNMKFMLNGAVTLGTYDGANVEIVQEAGEENNYIFGNTVETLKKLEKTYNPRAIYESDKEIKRVLDALDSGELDDGGTGYFKELKSSILDGASWHKPDVYYLLADFHSFIEAKLKVSSDYKKSLLFANKCLKNVANAGKFSSDRTIAEYAKDIWKIEPVQL